MIPMTNALLKVVVGRQKDPDDTGFKTFTFTTYGGKLPAGCCHTSI
jgi:hypothetical protein